MGAIAVAASGCHDPYRDEQARPAPTPPPQASGDAARPGPPALAPATVPGAREPGARAAADAFARAWINWDWRTVAAQQRSLAHLADRPLAAELRANAQTTATDASLQRDRPSSRGTVIAVDLRPGRRAASAVVVTREQTYTNGHADLGGGHHRVYRTRLTRRAEGWEVSAWTPLP